MRNLFLVDLFRIDKIKKEMIIIKEPYKRDAVLKIDDNKIEELMRRYKHFKYKEDSQYATFGQDLSDESNMSYHIRKRFANEYACYY